MGATCRWVAQYPEAAAAVTWFLRGSQHPPKNWEISPVVRSWCGLTGCRDSCRRGYGTAGGYQNTQQQPGAGV